MDNDNLLTIVIPQYNEDEQTIAHLLGSIDYQIGIDLKKVQLLIIGDGGYRLNQSLFEVFPNLKINYLYYKDSHGPGMARQIGLENTTSKYLAYMDADDQLNTVNSLWKFIDAIRKTGDHEIIISKYVEEHAGNPLNTYSLRDTQAAVYGKWLSVNYIREHKFSWSPQLPYAYEDTFFMDLLMIFAKDVYRLDIPTYSWLYNPSSIVRRESDYNCYHLDEYFKETRLWVEEMRIRAPQRVQFDVNNGLVNMYNFMVKHPAVDSIKNKTNKELDNFFDINHKMVNIEQCVSIYNERFNDPKAFKSFLELHLSRFKDNMDHKQNKRKLLSIVIPFNGNDHNLILPLLNSIQIQVGFDLNELKIIIVQDNGDANLDELQKIFPSLNIRVININKHLGPGPIRQIGLYHANSQFIMFCDADDEFHTVNSLLKMKNAALEHNEAEMIIGKYVNEQVDESGNHYLQECNYNLGAVYPIWFKMDFLNSYKIQFSPNLHSFYEDTFFVGIASRLAKNAYFLDDFLYTHKLNYKSLIHNGSQKELYKQFLVEYCKENYEWFNESRQRFPKMVSADLNNFIINIYYMYQKYNLEDDEIDKWLKMFNKKLIVDNKSFWNGWTPELQKSADQKTTGDAEDQSSEYLKEFIRDFFTVK